MGVVWSSFQTPFWWSQLAGLRFCIAGRLCSNWARLISTRSSDMLQLKASGGLGKPLTQGAMMLWLRVKSRAVSVEYIATSAAVMEVEGLYEGNVESIPVWHWCGVAVEGRSSSPRSEWVFTLGPAHFSPLRSGNRNVALSPQVQGQRDGESDSCASNIDHSCALAISKPFALHFTVLDSMCIVRWRLGDNPISIFGGSLLTWFHLTLIRKIRWFTSASSLIDSSTSRGVLPTPESGKPRTGKHLLGKLA